MFDHPACGSDPSEPTGSSHALGFPKSVIFSHQEQRASHCFFCICREFVLNFFFSLLLDLSWQNSVFLIVLPCDGSHLLKVLKWYLYLDWIQLISRIWLSPGHQTHANHTAWIRQTVYFSSSLLDWAAWEQWQNHSYTWICTTLWPASGMHNSLCIQWALNKYWMSDFTNSESMSLWWGLNINTELKFPGWF